MPFTMAQFFRVFLSYNEAVWPFQLVLAAFGLVAIGLLFVHRPSAGRVTSAILAFLWAWMAIVYHFLFFSRINPAAWAFGALFLVEAALFLWLGVIGGKFRFRVRADARTWAGALLLLYALVLYPLLGALLGERYLASPTFGLPCPTVIFTFGLLLFLAEPFPRLILAVPILWAAVGSFGAFQLGVPQDLGLLVAGLVGLVLAFAPRLSFWGRWVVANAAGELIGLGTVALAGWMLVSFSGTEETLLQHTLFALVMILLGACEGAVVGAAQAWVLVPRFPGLRKGEWVRATALGALVAWSLGMLPSTLMAAGAETSGQTPPEPGAAAVYGFAALLGAVAGLILALFQWRVLRRRLSGAGGWLAANAAAWALGMPLVFLGADLASRGGPIPVVAGILAATLLATGSVVGAIHGLWLVWRLDGQSVGSQPRWLSFTPGIARSLRRAPR